MQPIKNKINYSEYYSNEIQDIFNKMDETLLKEYPVIKITPEYFLFSCLFDKVSMVYEVLDTILQSDKIQGITDYLFEKINNSLVTILKPGREIPLSPELQEILGNSIEPMRDTDCTLLSSEHVLMSIIKNEEDSELKSKFLEEGITYENLKEASISIHYGGSIKHNNNTEDSDNTMKIKIFSPDQLNSDEISSMLGNIFNENFGGGNKKKQKLANGEIKYCTNITKDTSNIDNLIGREKELKIIENVFSRRKSNNVIIVGESGVGKTQIVEGLAKKIAESTCPKTLIGYKIFRLNIGEVMGGTSLRGMFEDRMSTLTKDLKNNKNSILFIDNVHTILNDKKTEEYDVGTHLSSILSDGSVKIIVTTTQDGYKTLIDSNAIFTRQFQRVDIDPASVKDTIDIINGIKGEYEDFHNVKYTDKAIEACAKLAERYIPERSLPSSAIDILDEAGASKKIENFGSDIIDVSIDENDIYKAISKHTNIPVSKINVSEKESLKNIDQILKENIIGQNEAIDVVSKAIKRNKVGLYPKNKPILSCMCIGETGVGKTLLAKSLSKEIFGDEKYLVRFDMSEYSDKTSVSKLIGSSAGYIGYDKGGLLTEAVKNRKYCVLLIDEIEKADEEIYNLFLQILDEGFLTDNIGTKVDFKNTIILLTSNVGTKVAAQHSAIGFEEDESENKKSIIEKELKSKFPPEFINRLDEIVYFNRLTDDNLKDIIKIEINKLNKRLNEINISLEYNDDIIEYIFNIIKSQKEFGARPIIRTIQSEIEDKIADLIIESTEDKNLFKIDVNDNILSIK